VLEHVLELGHLAVVGIQPAMISQHRVTPPPQDRQLVTWESVALLTPTIVSERSPGSLRWVTLS
jgi:hypothetical protein